MKKLYAAISVLALSACAAWADPAEGRWSTQPDDNGNTGVVTITMCGNTLCGTLGQPRDANGNPMDSPNTGRRIVWDMEPRGNGQYRGGRIWAPDRDQEYRATMDLAGDRLTVSGCFLVICREQVWTRID